MNARILTNVRRYGLPIVYALTLLCSALATTSAYLSPRSFWLAPMVSPVRPIAFLALLVTALILLYRRQLLLMSPCLLLLCANYDVPRQFFALNLPTEKEYQDSFRVMSFNASFFHCRTDFSNAYEDPHYNTTSVKMIHWLKKQTADLICIQEFYDDERSNIFNTVEKIMRNGMYGYHFVNKPRIMNGRLRGMVIFSKLPILHKGELFLDENRYNGAIYADVAREKDTLRVISVHLQSSELYTVRNRHSGLKRYKYMLYKIKHSALKRQHQLEQVISFAKSSPYPTLICGDFNESPYGYAYKSLKDGLEGFRNTHVDTGFGVGATYNTGVASFLRIDHHFYSPDIEAVGFKRYGSIDFTDHFPIEGEYRLRTTESY